MSSNATNPCGEAVEALLAAAIEQALDGQSTPEERAKINLALRPDFATPEMQALVFDCCEALHSSAETIACHLLNTILYGPEEDQ